MDMWYRFHLLSMVQTLISETGRTGGRRGKLQGPTLEKARPFLQEGVFAYSQTRRNKLCAYLLESCAYMPATFPLPVRER